MPKLNNYTFNQLALDIDVREVLKEKGIEYTEGRDGWVHMSCLFPDHDDKNPSFSIHTDHLAYKCWGCGRSGTWTSLCEKLEWETGIAGEAVLVDVVPIKSWEDTKRIMENKNAVEKVFHMPNGFRLINQYDRHWKYLKQRELNDDDVIKEFQIGMTIQDDDEYEKNYINRIIIPVHNPNGDIIWPEGRLIYKSKFRKYYRPMGVEKQNYLFSNHRAKFDHYVIVVEGIIDAITLWSWGYPAVATFGAAMSVKQMELLMYYDKIYLCYDNDKAGVQALIGGEGKVGIKDMLNGTGSELYRILLPRRIDVNDMPYQKFVKIYEKAVVI